MRLTALSKEMIANKKVDVMSANPSNTAQLEDRRQLAASVLARKNRQSPRPESAIYSAGSKTFDVRNFSTYPEVKAFNQQVALIAECGVANPYFRINETITGHRTQIEGNDLISYSGYNYLGYSGEPSVREKAKEAIDLFGTSPSASRLVTGEKPVHQQLEKALASFIGVESSLVFANGHATNVTVIGHFLNSDDLVIYDELSHNSVIEGCILSGARRIPFSHNDVRRCEQLIAENVDRYQKVLIVVEGAYSMDGDVSPLKQLAALRRKYPVLLYVDEAHSLGTIGRTGRGISEYAGVKPEEVDFWMGTLSKSLASNGGYIAGKRELIDYLKYTTPGFVYSAGITPANAAAALESLRLLESSSERVARLNANADYFREKALQAGLDIGPSRDTPIVPVIIGDSKGAIKLSDALYKAGVNVHPMFHPVVPPEQARLRFFLSSEHTREEIDYTIELIKRYIA
ncbi:aminotransferase class I/II-fold pyridoxal phosphate-dependent enzyme [Marinimicrobium agarilyticum]|uniref:aminotransferase class I/II-fold pyridoxal phosphate-dependent enzyme n=1 Tax=Marinimicrobium agarilyticum TaxID=306546 RepID=UPI00041FA85F|nr:aminotransferase class I/II-fold pyridoxal phosphate-dependent enzyme [Marinimicrobium agarilyticum]